MSIYDDLALQGGVMFDPDLKYVQGHEATVTSLWLDPYVYPCTCSIGIDHTVFVNA